MSKFTYQTFLDKANSLYGEKFDYSSIQSSQVNGTKSYGIIRCRDCEYSQSRRLSDFVYNKLECSGCKGTRVTLKGIKEKSKEIYGDQYDYRKASVNDINKTGIKTEITVICKVCDHEWMTKVTDHIHQKRGCTGDCSKRIRWTLESFLRQAPKIHGVKFDYSKLNADHFNDGVYSRLPIKCVTCDYDWSPSLNDHINNECGCPSCSQNVPWTVERFIKRSIEIHENKYDYSLIDPNSHITAKGKVTVRCNQCSYVWRPQLYDHIFGYGCPSCSQNAPWTLQRIKNRGNNEKFDYSEVKEEHIKGKSSKIPIKCRTCTYVFWQEINCHMNRDIGCPSCAENIPWTLERFLSRSREIHGDKYDYTMIKSEHIGNQKSRIPIKCFTCKFLWYPTIGGHINNQGGCSDCARVVPWSYDRFMLKSKEKHGDKYDYTLVLPEQVNGVESHITVKCNNCQYIWNPTIHSHITSGRGCPNCRPSSKGEMICSMVLSELVEEFQREVNITSLPNKRYDFYFVHDSVHYLLEFDGNQHFKYVPMFHGYDEEIFKERQKIDILKTNSAVKEGYRLIRIAYIHLDSIKDHILLALDNINEHQPLYLSDRLMYSYILDGIKMDSPSSIKSLE